MKGYTSFLADLENGETEMCIANKLHGHIRYYRGQPKHKESLMFFLKICLRGQCPYIIWPSS